jgi:hypothetical protein
MGSPTECLTLSTSEWPKDAAVCSLSDILETGDLPPRFFLSAKACSGILRRAEKRGRQLPPLLQMALERGADISNTVREEIGVGDRNDPAFTLQANHSHAVAFAQNQLGEVRTSNIAGTLNRNSNASGRNTPLAMIESAVRRLTPVECERLQGFPDNYTLILCGKKTAADGPRYKALGNSMAVPVMRWIGQRISRVESSRKMGFPF